MEIYGKMGEKPPFLGIFEVWYGTKQCGTGTILVLVDWYRYRKVGTGTQCSVLDQC